MKHTLSTIFLDDREQYGQDINEKNKQCLHSVSGGAPDGRRRLIDTLHIHTIDRPGW